MDIKDIARSHIRIWPIHLHLNKVLATFPGSINVDRHLVDSSVVSHKMHPDEDVQDNLLNWSDRAVVHANCGYGDLDAFADDPSALSPATLYDLEVLKPHRPEHSINGLCPLHLQCHIGTDVLSW